MKKTFRRVLASMLAILMIVCSMPFTVFAAETNRKWWINDGIDPSTITAEPEFVGYNCDDPDETWDLSFGDQVDFTAGYEDHRDDYKPLFAITVSDVGSKGEDISTLGVKYSNNYAATSARTFDAAMADGTIINPANLKAGQRIAVTFEMGGFDIINVAQVLGHYDSEYIIPGYYTSKPNIKKGDTWVSATTGSNPWKTANALYASQGDALAFAASAVTEDRWQTGVAGTACFNGQQKVSNYIGRNAEERGFDSPYGIVMGTLFLEVQKDCDLKDVFIPSEKPDGCIIEPIYRTVYNDGLYNGSIGDYDHSFVNMPVIWTAYSKGSEPSCDHANTTTTTEVTTAATCETAGVETVTETCNDCGEVVGEPTTNTIPALGHNYVEVEGSAVAPTVDAAGKKADQQCTRCDDVIVGEAIPALASYEITVAATDLGVVTLNGADVTNGAKVKVEAGSTVTLTAEPIEGAKFLGWTANGLTTVSTDTTFTTVALANVTYAPVFEKADAASFTVVFADAFGNIVSSQVVTDGSQIVIPDAPARSGYVAATENGWTMTNEEIQALTSSATVIAVYELAENEGYTVTANGATITGDGIEATDVATGVAYDTLVTVYKEGAKGWAVNGVTVAYGDTYSFYVGKDIEVVAVMDGVTAVPMVANVGVNEVGQPGRIQAQFIATRTMADGYTYIDSGFVYGKGDLGEITLFDVDGSAVKAAYTKTASEQFSVTYGLSAQTGTITARAFIAYANADGEVTVTYGAPMTYQYK